MVCDAIECMHVCTCIHVQCRLFLHDIHSTNRNYLPAALNFVHNMDASSCIAKR